MILDLFCGSGLSQYSESRNLIEALVGKYFSLIQHKGGRSK